MSKKIKHENVFKITELILLFVTVTSTIYLLLLTKTQINLAETALNEAKFNDSINRNYTKIALDLAYESNKSNDIFTTKSLSISDSSLSLSKGNFRIENRAYMSFQFDSVQDKKQPFFAYFHFTNAGKTIAKNVKTNYGFAFLPVNTKIEPILIDKKSPVTSVYHPGGQFRIFMPLDQILESHDWEALWSNKKTFYIWGKLVYDDVFGDHHYTSFCMKYTTDLGSFTFYSNYNEAN